MAIFRRSQVVRRRRDGDFELVLAQPARDLVRQLLAELEELLDGDPDDPNLRRLRPPAYLDDDEADAAYQLLAGEELRTSRREAVAGVVESLGRDHLTEGDLWAWMQSLNAIRLVLGTRLDVAEDDLVRPEVGPHDPEAQLWSIYDLVTFLQHEVVTALGG